ncbi:MAG TPA: hypothetical protein VMT62_12715 [Syntrophorhabdaceae bacterium]|nr:hypothetical protein [Syntrophorhabdaceae bacterium]
MMNLSTRKSKWKKAIVAVARMLIRRYRACLISGTPYVIVSLRSR